LMITEICVTSDDGSKLYLDGNLTIDNDGLHSVQRRCAPISPGDYRLDLEYFERVGHVHLVLEWADPDRGRRVIPARSWMAAPDPRITVKYYHVEGWSSLPIAGLDSLVPYKTSTAFDINYKNTNKEFADSGKSDNVAALFTGYLHVHQLITELCITSNDGSKVYLDGILTIDNDGLQASRRVCAPVSDGMYKIDIEYFDAGGHAALILEWVNPNKGLKVVPAEAFSSADAVHRFRNLMKLNEHLEEDLRTLKESDLMGPSTRAEFNRRRDMKLSPEERERKLKNKPDFSKLDKVLFSRRYEHLMNMNTNKNMMP